MVSATNSFFSREYDYRPPNWFVLSPTDAAEAAAVGAAILATPARGRNARVGAVGFER